jgi:hypothetical protein
MAPLLFGFSGILFATSAYLCHGLNGALLVLGSFSLVGALGYVLKDAVEN